MLDEDLLQFIWAQKVYGVKLYTTEGAPIQILNPGRWNQDAGPDFLDAKILIGDTQWAGHVEVHVKSALWHSHGHDGDTRYDPTVLHVVWERTEDKLDLPTLQLSDFVSPTQLNRYARLRTADTKLACQDFTFNFPSVKWTAFRDTLLAERMQRRAEGYADILQQNSYDWADLLYLKVARALGQNKNGQAMQDLAIRLPMNILARHKNNLLQIESLLFGVSGLLPKQDPELYVQQLITESQHFILKYKLRPMAATEWVIGGLRPANFPTLRLAQLAMLVYKSQHLLARLIDTPDLTAAKELFGVTASSYWDTHYTFGSSTHEPKPKRLGRAAIHGLFINTVIPMLWSYGEMHQDYDLQERMMDWLHKIPAESNQKIKTMLEIQLPNKNAADSQALLELYDQYCIPRQCLRCLIGREIMSA